MLESSFSRDRIKGYDFDAGLLDKPLHLAIKHGRTGKAKQLINDGADIHQLDYYKRTPLMMAAIFGRMEIAEILIKKGANVEAVSEGNWTPIICASAYGFDKIVKLLIDRTADVNVRDELGNSALFYAIEHHHIPVINLLSQNGADLHTPNEAGFTPLDYAMEVSKNPEVINSVQCALQSYLSLKIENMTPQELALLPLDAPKLLKNIIISGTLLQVFKRLPLQYQLSLYKRTKQHMNATEKTKIQQLILKTRQQR